MAEVAFIFSAALLITIFLRPAWLNGTVAIVGLVSIFSAAAISIANSGWRDLTPLYLWGGAWLWGMVIGKMVKWLWAGWAQAYLQDSKWWLTLNWLMCAFWLTWAAGCIGYAVASNAAMIYAENREATWTLYSRSIAATASGFFFLSLAAGNAVTAFARSKLTSKGLCTSTADTVRWKEVASYEWQGNKLIVHREVRSSQARQRDLAFVVNPHEVDTVKRLLLRFLSHTQPQPPAPLQSSP